MRFFPPISARFGLLLAITFWIASPAGGREIAEAVYHPYRADLEAAVPAGLRPARIRLLAPPGEEAWNGAPGEVLAQRIRREWTGQVAYGAIRPGVPLFLTYPLVTTAQRDRVLVPVLSKLELPIRGALLLPRAPGPRRVVVLVDASLSSNSPIRFDPARTAERITVLEAERRALEHIVQRIDDRVAMADSIELGVIAFGETIRPVAEPGLPLDQLRARLQAFRAEVPKGEGRTDLVCALWLAREWLDDAPSGYARELVLLTDGDLPHSGRFLDCGTRKRLYGEEAEARCEADRNRSVCPASHRFRRSHGRTDLTQLAYFARRARRALKVFPLVFETDRAARPYQKLARQTGGELVRVSSPHSLEAALPALVVRDLLSVRATNERTGERTPNLLDPETGSFEGSLALEAGANDVELRVEASRGLAGLFRFRIYAEPDHLERFLSDLRESNRALKVRAEQLIEELPGEFPTERSRSLDLLLDETPPAAPGDG
ncbi:MAG: vWA domain-containing protein [Myxococcota bacterium]|nr:vWA domain-containing protein [Myxococcota bacterium]